MLTISMLSTDLTLNDLMFIILFTIFYSWLEDYKVIHLCHLQVRRIDIIEISQQKIIHTVEMVSI